MKSTDKIIDIIRNLKEEDVLEALEKLKNQLGRSAFKVNGTRIMNTKKSIQSHILLKLFVNCKKKKITF